MSPWESLWMPWKLHEYRGKLEASDFLQNNEESKKLCQNLTEQSKKRIMAQGQRTVRPGKQNESTSRHNK